MATILRLQNSAQCPHCGSALLCREWSESVAPQRVVHIWRCLMCELEFETTEQGEAQTLQKTELERAFFASLLVA